MPGVVWSKTPAKGQSSERRRARLSNESHGRYPATFRSVATLTPKIGVPTFEVRGRVSMEVVAYASRAVPTVIAQPECVQKNALGTATVHARPDEAARQQPPGSVFASSRPSQQNEGLVGKCGGKFK